MPTEINHYRRRFLAAAAMTVAAVHDKFSGKYEFRLITGGVGHNIPQEAPHAFAQAIVDVDKF